MKYYLIRVGIILKKILPEFIASTITITLAYLSYFFLKQRKEILKQNLKHLTGSANKKLIKETFINFAIDYMNFLAIPSMTNNQIKKFGKARGFSNLDKALSSKKGAILVSAHLGPWDLASCFLASFGHPTITLVESKGPGAKMFNLYSKLRAKTGMEVLPLENRDSMKKMIKGLKENKILILLGDRDLTGKGVKVKFLGGEYQLPKGPALLSLKYRIPVITGSFIKEDIEAPQKSPFYRRRYTGIIDPQIDFVKSGNIEQDIRNLTQLIAERLEEKIKTYPTQWYVFQMDWNHRSRK
ncbi:lysophospholipid acyltransferase family protein [candidate division WOR-3 bacterium]|nr:lysophospholipid acyltransferase family protein [candidate division WOR-3 bacterium]